MADSKMHLIRLFLWPRSAPRMDNSTHVTHDCTALYEGVLSLGDQPWQWIHHTPLPYIISQGVFQFNHLNLHKSKLPREVTSRMPSPLKLTIHHPENREARTTGSRGNVGCTGCRAGWGPRYPSGSAYFTQDR